MVEDERIPVKFQKGGKSRMEEKRQIEKWAN